MKFDFQLVESTGPVYIIRMEELTNVSKRLYRGQMGGREGVRRRSMTSSQPWPRLQFHSRVGVR